MENYGLIGIAACLALAAVGSAVGAGAAGMSAVGAWNSEGTMSRYINARFDDIRIYNRVLSQGEITYLTGVPAGTNRWWPPNSLAEFVSDEAWGQKYINFRDYAFIMNYWLVDQLFPFVE